MQFNIKDADIIFISYDEPNAEYNWSALKAQRPDAKRVDKIKGFDAAHKEAAKLSSTEYFVTIDGDSLVNNKFFTHSFDLIKNIHTYSWDSRNYINDLIYGNGGAKLWNKEYTLNMQTHELSKNSIDFCWNTGYLNIHGKDIFTITCQNSSPFQAFRAGFREGVKLSLFNGIKLKCNFTEKLDPISLRNLKIWMTIGVDVENGEYAIYGARLGTYMVYFEDFDFTNINNYDWLLDFYKNQNIEKSISNRYNLLTKLNNGLGLGLAELDAEQSKFFKNLNMRFNYV